MCTIPILSSSLCNIVFTSYQTTTGVVLKISLKLFCYLFYKKKRISFVVTVVRKSQSLTKGVTDQEKNLAQIYVIPIHVFCAFNGTFFSSPLPYCRYMLYTRIIYYRYLWKVIIIILYSRITWPFYTLTMRLKSHLTRVIYILMFAVTHYFYCYW